MTNKSIEEAAVIILLDFPENKMALIGEQLYHRLIFCLSIIIAVITKYGQ